MHFQSLGADPLPFPLDLPPVSRLCPHSESGVMVDNTARCRDCSAPLPLSAHPIVAVWNTLRSRYLKRWMDFRRFLQHPQIVNF